MTTTLAHTDPARVLAVVVDDHAPYYGRNADGYGGKIPTRYRLRYRTAAGPVRVLRVYVACYGNAGSAYVCTGGVDHYLDTDTEHDLYAAAE